MMNKKEKKEVIDCGRKEDLVTYLYGEMADAEKADFSHHLAECAGCREEWGAFERVRDDLSTWQVGFAPVKQIEMPRPWTAIVREFFLLFPVWARGVAMTAAAACLVVFALSALGPRARSAIFTGASAGLDRSAVESLVNDAVAREKEQLEASYRTQLTSFQEQVRNEYQTQIETINAQHEARIKTMQAAWKADLRRNNRQMNSIRSYFALDDTLDSWGRGGQER